MNNNIIKLYLDWRTYIAKVEKLSENIIKSNVDFDYIVMCGRGGLIPGRILSDYTGKPVFFVGVKRYRDKEGSRVELYQDIPEIVKGKSILLIDDLVDEGKTLEFVYNLLKNKGAKEVKTAVIFVKPWSKFHPDFYVEETDKWVVFPYEKREEEK